MGLRSERRSAGLARSLARRREPGPAPTDDPAAPIALAGQIRRDEVAGVVARIVRRMAGRGPDRTVVSLAPDDCRDLATIDVVAQLVLAARRARQPIRFADLSPEMLELVELCGLGTVVAPTEPDAAAGSAGEVVG